MEIQYSKYLFSTTDPTNKLFTYPNLLKTLNYRLSWMQHLSTGALDYVHFYSNHQQNEAGGRRSRLTRCKDPRELNQRARKKLKESLKITGFLTTNPLW